MKDGWNWFIVLFFQRCTPIAVFEGKQSKGNQFNGIISEWDTSAVLSTAFSKYYFYHCFDHDYVYMCITFWITYHHIVNAFYYSFNFRSISPPFPRSTNTCVLQCSIGRINSTVTYQSGTLVLWWIWHIVSDTRPCTMITILICSFGTEEKEF